MATPSKEKSDDQALLETARKRFDLAVEAESENRKQQLDDLEFLAGKQWPEDVRQARELDRRPCLTINRLPQFANSVTNDLRQNRPAIKVNPVDDASDVETAKILQGLVRHIEYNSNADVAYDTGTEGAVSKGLGYFRVTTDYCDPMSFDQEIYIKRIRNSFSVYLDPYYQEPDASDSNWGFVFEEMPLEEYKSQFPDSDVARMEDWVSIGDKAPGWVNKESVRVAEYLFKSFKKIELVQFSNGQTMPRDKVPKVMPEGIKEVGSRESVLPAIQWCKINGIEVLERTDWLGQWIPIIPVIGSEFDIDGRKDLQGIVRNAKDPQRMYNYWASSETETIALAPRAPFIGYAGQFEGFEQEWKTANVKNYAYLEVNPLNILGQPAPLPQRNVFEAPVQAITQARMQSSEDMKATTGVYDAALGNRSNENSGVAIQRRTSQAQTSNFHYADNLTRALRHCGRILIDLIPKVYDTARTARIIGEDGEIEMVKINQIFDDKGVQKAYMLNKGKYDVTVTTGPSYSTKRQEAAAAMLDLSKAAPQLMQFAPDLVIGQFDFPMADKLADRMKKTLPPGIADDESKDGQPPIPPQAKQQMQHMGQMIDQLTAAVHSAQDKLDQKTLELESKERIAFAQMQNDLVIAEIKAGAADAQLAFELEMKDVHKRLDLLHMNQPLDSSDAGAQPAEPPQDQPPAGGPAPAAQMEQ